MARKQARPEATQKVVLEPVQITCRACGSRMRMARHSQRTVTTLQGVTHLTLKVYRCRNTDCPRFHQATRPEEEGRWALPHGEFGLDVIALDFREAAKPMAEADRHAKKELKKQVRGVRPIERALEKRADDEAEVVRGYCLAVRSALTDDGQPPLDAAGLRLHDRLQAILTSIARIEEKRGFLRSWPA